jgi:hypothetical protein
MAVKTRAIPGINTFALFISKGQMVVINFGGLGLLGNRDHILEQDLQRHAMSTALMGDKEFAIALEHAVFKTNFVIVIVAVKSNIELVEAKTVLVFRVTLGFFDFSDHSVIHTLSPFRFEILLLEMKPGFPD